MIKHGPVRSLGEAARARGVEPRDVVKTLVVRRAEGDFLFLLVDAIVADVSDPEPAPSTHR